MVTGLHYSYTRLFEASRAKKRTGNANVACQPRINFPQAETSTWNHVLTQRNEVRMFFAAPMLTR
jgi:hypothetical protein